MKIFRKSQAQAKTNAELLSLCDGALDEEAFVQVAMEDIDRLGITAWEWDIPTQTAWVQVSLLRFAVIIDGI